MVHLIPEPVPLTICSLERHSLILLYLSMLQKCSLKQNYISTNCAGEFPFFTSSPALTVCRFFDDDHSDLGFPGGSSSKEPACLCRKFETLVRSLGQEDPMEKEMATYSSILAWRIPMDRGAWWATVHGVTKSRTWLKWLSPHSDPSEVISYCSLNLHFSNN